MFESKVPGIRAFIYGRYRCDLCGYTSTPSAEDRPFCPHDNNAMTPETTSVDERMANIRADRLGR